MNYTPPCFKSIYAQKFVKRVVFMGAGILLIIGAMAFFVPGPIQKQAYMGAEYCGSCHKEEYKSWATSLHAKAFARLPIEKKSDMACLQCHATGVSDNKDNFLPGVSCESCHGPGQYYAPLHIKKDEVLSKLLFMQKPNEDSCRHCHQASNSQWVTDLSKASGFHGTKIESYNGPAHK